MKKIIMIAALAISSECLYAQQTNSMFNGRVMPVSEAIQLNGQPQTMYHGKPYAEYVKEQSAIKANNLNKKNMAPPVMINKGQTINRVPDNRQVSPGLLEKTNSLRQNALKAAKERPVSTPQKDLGPMPVLENQRNNDKTGKVIQVAEPSKGEEKAAGIEKKN